jgi:hypothetical protein
MHMPTARGLQWTTATKDERVARAELAEIKPSLWQGIGAAVGIVAVSLMAVLTPAFGPPAEEVAALNQAKETQMLAQGWIATHPEAAIPAGDERAWGFFVPGQGGDSSDCSQMWAGSADAC